MKATQTTPDAERFLGKPELSERLGFDPATISRKCAAGEFPRPVYIFGRARWRLADIQAWEAANVSNEPPAKTANLRNQRAAP